MRSDPAKNVEVPMREIRRRLSWVETEGIEPISGGPWQADLTERARALAARAGTRQPARTPVRGRGWQEFTGVVHYRGTARLTRMYVQKLLRPQQGVIAPGPSELHSAALRAF